MISIVLLGRSNDRKLHTFLEKNLRKTFPLISLSSGSYSADMDAEIALLDDGSITSINASDTLIIVKQNSGHIPEMKIQSEKTVIIVPSECKDAIDFAAGISLPTITCGLGSKDSFTFSSLAADEAVISIQRTVTTFTDTLIEPSEFPVKLDEPADSYDLLCLAVILAFAERLDSLRDIII